MSEQWVWGPDQQALAEAQAIVDAQSRADIVVRHYPGSQIASVSDFKTDAAQMIPAGWHPISLVYARAALDPATVLALGAMAGLSTPGGALIVTYRYESANSPAVVVPSVPDATS